MPNPSIAIRLGIDGEKEIVGAHDRVAASGQAAFGGVARAAEQASTATDRATAATERQEKAWRAQASAVRAALNPTGAAQSRLQAELELLGTLGKAGALSLTEMAAAEDQARSRFVALAESLDTSAQKAAAVRAQIDPLGAAQARLNSELSELAALGKSGALSLGELASAQDLARKRFDDTARSLDANAQMAAALRAQIDPLGAAQARLNAELAQYRSLADAGAISGDERSAGEALARRRYEDAARSLDLNAQKAAAVRAQIDPLAAAQARLNAELGDLAALGQAGALSLVEVGAAQDLARRRYDDTARSLDVNAQKAAALRAQLDPLSAAQAKLNAELAEYRRLASAGAITGGERSAGEALARRRYDEAARSLDLNAQKAAAVRAQIDPLSAAEARLNAELGELASLGASGALSLGEVASAQDLARKRFDDTARSLDANAQKAAALRAQIDPLGVAQAKLNAELAEYGRLASAGAITGDERSAGEALARRRYADTARALDLNAQKAAAVRAQIDPLGAAQAKLNGELGELAALGRAGALGVAEVAAAQALARKRFEETAQALDSYQAKATALRAMLDPLGAAQARLNAELADYAGLAKAGVISSGELAAAEDQARKRFEATARALDLDAAKAAALRAQIDPLAAAEARLNTELREYEGLARRGAISTDELSAAQALARRRFDETARAVTGAGRSVSAAEARFARLNLLRQGADVFTTAAMGMNPGMIAIQQGPQILDALASSGFRASAGLLATGGAVAALVGGMVGLVAVSEHVRAEQARIAIALDGVGAASGATVAQIQAVGQAQADAGRMGASAARELALAMASAKVPAADLGQAVNLVRDYAVAVRSDVKSATPDLVAAFADPARGAELLNAKLSFLVPAEIDHIRALQDQGDKAGALKVLMVALGAATDGLAGRQGGLARVVHEASTAFDNAVDAVERYIAKLANLPSADPQQRLQELLSRQREGPGAATQLIGRLLYGSEEEYKNQLAVFGRVADLDRQIASARQEIADNARRKAQAAQSEAAGALRASAEALAPTNSQISRIRAEQDRLKKALNDPKLLADARLTRQQAQDAISQGDRQIAQLQKKAEGSDRHADSLAREAAAMSASTAAARKLADAYLVATAAGEAAEVRRQALTQATRRGADLDAAIRRQREAASAEAAATGARHVAALRDQNDAQARLNRLVAAGLMPAAEARQALQNEAALRDLVSARDNANAVDKARLTRVIAALRVEQGRANAETAKAEALAAAAGQDRQIAALETQIRLAGDLTGARERELALLQARAEAADRGFSAEDRAAFVARTARIVELQQASARADYLAEAARRQAESAALTRAQIGLIGQTEAVQAKVLGRLQAENELRAQGVDLASELAQRILQGVEAQSALDVELRRMADAWNAFQRIGGGVIDDVLSPQSWKDWGETGKRILGDIQAELMQLGVANPLKNALLGQSNPTLGSMGGILGALFGRGASSPFVQVGPRSLPPLTPPTWPDPHFPSFDTGTAAAPGGLAYVHKDELLNVPQGSRVYNAEETRRLLRPPAAGGGGKIEIHNHTGVQAEPRVQRQGNGDTRIDLYPILGRGLIAEAGRNGDLARAARASPGVTKRG